MLEIPEASVQYFLQDLFLFNIGVYTRREDLSKRFQSITPKLSVEDLQREADRLHHNINVGNILNSINLN